MTVSSSPSSSGVKFDCGACVLRPFAPADAASIAELADERDIWLMVRDRFPHPYTVRHAEEFIADAGTRVPPTNLAITVDGRAVGSISLFLQTDIERVSGELGYWLGKPYWGRGIMTPAVQAMTGYAIRTFSLTRVFAIIASHNVGSMRVLDKAGFVREGFMKQSSIKDGVVQDQYLYGFYA